MISSTFLLIAVSLLSSTSNAVSVKRAITPLPANGKWDYQIGGAYEPDSDVRVVTRDRTSTPVSGKYNICYVNAFQSQPDQASHDFWLNDPTRNNLILKNSAGQPYEDDGWPGEYYFDTRTADKRQALANIVNGWIDECKQKGFNAIEPDNLDTFTRSDDLLSEDNNLDYAKLLADHAHATGVELAFGQKNTGGELEDRGKARVGFDFAIAEECQAFKECDSYTDVYGDQVLEVEYFNSSLPDNNRGNFTAACTARGSRISVIFRDVFVVPRGSSGYVYEEC
ncbi:hypothetical protein AAF712_003360 [Marasmius tenuissimus]|uniref:alpha-galactosidase n=1 Tax=Marasmius tenuissimus TaxID=585030 RepID=A0ABR3A859_9AGAR|nr:hypothetical protein PM082_012223 [Marasmius tenuissimus]